MKRFQNIRLVSSGTCAKLLLMRSADVTVNLIPAKYVVNNNLSRTECPQCYFRHL